MNGFRKDNEDGEKHVDNAHYIYAVCVCAPM